MLCAILYLEKSDRARFSDLKKGIESDYVLDNNYYPRTVTTVQSLILNYQPNYNSNRQYQSNGVSNKLIFVQCGKTGDDDGEKKRQESETPKKP